jgi:hypothetical protein
MRPSLALALLLLAPAAIAQSNVVLEASSTQSCPVGVYAQHSPLGAVEQIRTSTAHHQLAYNITLRALDTRLIAQARITLLGLSGPQVLPVGQNATSSPNAAETFTLTPGATAKPSFDSVVYAHKLTGVRFIQLDDVTYADGTQWHQTSGRTCRVAPNGLLLINATAH